MLPPSRTVGLQPWQNTTLSLVRVGRGLYADFAFGAVEQAGNIFAVHEPERRGQKKKEHRNIRPTKRPKAERREGASNQCRKRRIAGCGGNRQPDHAKCQCRWPVEADEHTDVGRDAFAALELQPHREEVTDKSPEAGRKRRVDAKMFRHEYGDGALEHVAEERGSCEPSATRAQHIGGPDIAGADRADIGGAGSARQQKPEWNGSEQIAEREGESVAHTYS